MSTSGVDLRYLWAVRYEDGSDLVQNPADVSRKDATRSSWFDVELDRVRLLALVNPGTGDPVAAVDLATGFFYIAGARVSLGDNPPHDPACGAFRPVFFRQISRSQVVGASGPEGSETVSVRYCIGWESTTNDGKTTRAVFGLY